MTIPGQTVHTKTSHATRPEPASQAGLGDAHARRARNTSNPLTVCAPPVPPVADNLADLASAENTRAALLKLGDSPRDIAALSRLWNENRPSIENELHRHLHSGSNSPLLDRLLARLAWHARFFCEEVDDPKAWVARAANLEARRLALEFTKPR